MSSFSGAVFLSVLSREDATSLVQTVHRSVSQKEQQAIHHHTKVFLQSKKKDGWRGESSCTGSFQGSIYALVDSDAIYVAAIRNPEKDGVLWGCMESFNAAVRMTHVDLKASRAIALQKLLRPMREVMSSFNGGESSRKQKELRFRIVQELDEADIYPGCESDSDSENSWASLSTSCKSDSVDSLPSLGSNESVSRTSSNLAKGNLISL